MKWFVLFSFFLLEPASGDVGIHNCKEAFDFKSIEERYLETSHVDLVVKEQNILDEDQIRELKMIERLVKIHRIKTRRSFKIKVEEAQAKSEIRKKEGKKLIKEDQEFLQIRPNFYINLKIGRLGGWRNLFFSYLLFEEA